jgi:serine phosphatase RsbU (regulator of sigma subunit)
VTALARYTLRIAALDDGPPSQALERLNDAMLAGDTSQFATVVLAYAQPCGEGCMRVRLALGGHPPPLVMRADGSVDAPGEFGSLLGAHLGPTLVDTEITLRPGDAMLLYTDGVTEAGARTAPFGADGLVNALRGMTGAAPHAIVDVVERAVVDAQEGEPRDDIALLALAVPRLEAADPPPAP